MKVSSKTDYALKTLVDMGIHQGDGAIPVGDMARRQAIPQKFLEQILLLLKSAGIVNSTRGVKGGYVLSTRPSQISLAKVLAVTERDLLSKRSHQIEAGREPQSASEQLLSEIWDDISDCIQQRLESITIEDMCERLKELSNNSVPNYVI